LDAALELTFRQAGPGIWNHVLTRRPRKMECGAICHRAGAVIYRGTSITRNRTTLGPYSRTLDVGLI